MLLPKLFAITLIAILFSPHTYMSGTELASFSKVSEKHSANSETDLEIIRKRIIRDLLEPVVEESLIQSLMKSVKPDGSWPDIDYDNVSRTGFQHSRHLDNMFQLS